jgi:integrase
MAKYQKVRVVKNPKYNTWSIHYTNIDGRRRRPSVGPDRQHAERQAIQYEEWLNKGTDPELEEKKLKHCKALTLREIEPLYVSQHMIQCSQRYQEMHKERWTMLSQCPQIADAPMTEIRKTMVRDYREARKVRDGVSNATVNRDTGKLQSMLNWAVKEEYIDRNPLHGLEKLREKEKRRVKLPPAEMNRLVQAMPIMPGLITQFAYYTGARKDSILDLKVSQVQFYDIHNNGVYGQVALNVKGGRLEVIPLERRVVAILTQALDGRDVTPDSYVFASPRTGTRYNRRFSVFDRAVRRIGIVVGDTPLQFHDLRRNVGTQLRHGGAGRDDIQALLTQKDPGSVERYFYDDRLQLGHLLRSIPTLGKENKWQEIGKVEDTDIRKRTQNCSQVLNKQCRGEKI